MKLYYTQGSPNCRKVHAVLNQLGLEVDFEYLDFFDGDFASDKFGQINPNRMVPVLVDGDLNLWESNAINQYLADKVPGNTIFPKELALRAEITRWLCWELAHYNQALGTLSFESVAKPNYMHMEPDQALIERCVAKLNQYAPVLEASLQGRDYLVGDGLTLADYAVAHQEMFVDAVPFDWTGYPNITAYYERMRNNPHWAKTAVAPEAMGRRPS